MKKHHYSNNIDEIKNILFREIEMVLKPIVSILSNAKKENSLIMVANKKVYNLVAKSEDDWDAWIAGFEYIIASTKAIQTLLKENQDKADFKIKTITSQITQST